MPTYGYRCTACATTFERIQKITDPPITACVECGSPVKKILYPVGIQFKGSGFYVNDYAPKSGGESKSSGESGGESQTGAKTAETKPEAKTETKSESAPAAPAATTPS